MDNSETKLTSEQEHKLEQLRLLNSMVQAITQLATDANDDDQLQPVDVTAAVLIAGQTLMLLAANKMAGEMTDDEAEDFLNGGMEVASAYAAKIIQGSAQLQAETETIEWPETWDAKEGWPTEIPGISRELLAQRVKAMGGPSN